jgi:hypothetical protein
MQNYLNLFKVQLTLISNYIDDIDILHWCYGYITCEQLNVAESNCENALCYAKKKDVNTEAKKFVSPYYFLNLIIKSLLNCRRALFISK